MVQSVEYVISIKPLLLLTLLGWLITGGSYADEVPDNKPVEDTSLSEPLDPKDSQLFAIESTPNELPLGEFSTLPDQPVADPFNLPNSTAAASLGGNHEVLHPDVAFVLSTYLESDSVLVAHWQIAEGHYLYRDQFSFTLTGGGVLGEPQLPTGIMKEDLKYGSIAVYEHNVTIKLPLQEHQGLDNLTLIIRYQGCAEARLCYPPIEKTIVIDLPETATLSATPAVAEPAANQTDSQPQLPTSKETTDSKSWFITGWRDMTRWLGLDHNKPKFLDPEQAFIFSTAFPNAEQLILRWHIAEGYYLYRNKLKFTLQSPGQLGTPQLPPSVVQTDKVLGEVEVYQQPVLEITIPIQVAELPTITLQVEYQGCAIAGLCYPPIKKVIQLTLGQNYTTSQPKSADLTLNQDSVVSEQDRLAHILASANVFYTIILFFGLGILLSFTPCVFPMIPILSGIIVGQGVRVTTSRAFLMSLIYVLAMAVTYAIVGVLTGLLGENLQAIFQQFWVLVAFALVFIALALSMFGFYELQMPSALQTHFTKLSNRQQGGTLIGVAIMGILSALIVGPCVAAPLMGALIYIGQTGDAVLGGFALFFMSLGMGIPLIIVGSSAGHWLPRAGEWMEVIKAIFGVMLLAIAIWMLDRVVPAQITMLLTATLLIVSAVYMGALDSIKIGVSGWRRLWKGLGIILLVYGILLLIGAASGPVNLLQPLQHLSLNQGKPNANDNTTSLTTFKPIKGLDELIAELAAATEQNQPVMLDFYADWCISCKEMEHLTFADTKVQQLLTHFVLLQADVTSNDAQDKALYKHFGIYGPPAILFFDQTGQEQRAYRIVGFKPADQFSQHLKQVLQP